MFADGLLQTVRGNMQMYRAAMRTMDLCQSAYWADSFMQVGKNTLSPSIVT